MHCSVAILAQARFATASSELQIKCGMSGRRVVRKRASLILWLLCSHEVLHVSGNIGAARKDANQVTASQELTAVSARSSSAYFEDLFSEKVDEGSIVDRVVEERGLLSSRKEEMPGPVRVEKVFDSADRDHDDELSRTEFRHAAESIVKNDQSERTGKKSQTSVVSHFSENNKHNNDQTKQNNKNNDQITTEFFIRGAGGPCLVSVLLAWIMCAATIGTVTFNTRKTQYTLLGSFGCLGASRSAVNVAVNLAAILYWFVMPATMLVFGYSSDCENGPPDQAYQVYGGFFALHGIIACFAATKADVPAFFGSKIMESFSVLLFQAALEHFDMATDNMFPGTSFACKSHITPLWLESWRQSLIPPFVVPVLEAMKFDGFALTAFIGFAYVPQLLLLSPFAGCASGLVLFLGAGLWVSHGWLFGIIPIVLAYAGYGVGLFMGVLVYWGGLLTGGFDSLEALAVYAGLPIFNIKQAHGISDPKTRLFFMASTKLLGENLLQLWIQSSSFSLAFAFLNDAGKKKALVSMVLGLGVSAAKIVEILATFVPILRYEGLLFRFGFVPLLTLGGGVWLWVIAKIHFAYVCESHVWNLTSGCVKM